jgi:hypothetical protein
VSVDLRSPDGEFVVGWMAENRIGIPVDFAIAVQNYELSSDDSATGPALPAVVCVCPPAKEFLLISCLLQSSSRRLSIQAMLMRQITSIVVLSWAKALISTSNAGFYIIERQCLGLIRKDYITLCAVLNMAKRIGHGFIRAAKHYCLAAELNDGDAEKSFRICVERELEFNRILCLRRTIMNDRHSKAILTAQIILISVSSTVEELSRTFDLQLNIIDRPSFVSILKAD